MSEFTADDSVKQIPAATAAAAIYELERRAVRGDVAAIRQLIEVGGELVSALLAVWSESTRARSLDPDDEHNARKRDLRRRRVMLRYTAQEEGFLPVLADVPWLKSHWNKKTKRREKSDTPPPLNVERCNEMLTEMKQETVLLRERGGQSSLARWALESFIIPRIEEAQAGIRNEPAFAILPSLTRKSATMWATASAEVIMRKQGQAVKTRGTDWNLIAGNGTKKYTQRLKEWKRTTGRQVAKLRRDHLHGKVTARRAHRKSSRPSKTDADYKAGLYDAFLKGLKVIALR